VPQLKSEGNWQNKGYHNLAALTGQEGATHFFFSQVLPVGQT
jgi:hypothetical protein